MHHPGRLLVATPVLDDPNFTRTVVLVLDHDDDGALGVVLNRPTEVPADDLLDDWTSLLAAPGVLFTGGPVEPRAMVGLGLSRPGDAVPTISGAIRAVDLSAAPSDVALDVRVARVFAGYAGWAPGQLEDELDEDAWVVVEPTDDDVVTDDPEGLWSRVLERQGGSLRLLARFPEDPRLN